MGIISDSDDDIGKWIAHIPWSDSTGAQGATRLNACVHCGCGGVWLAFESELTRGHSVCQNNHSTVGQNKCYINSSWRSQRGRSIHNLMRIQQRVSLWGFICVSRFIIELPQTWFKLKFEVAFPNLCRSLCVQALVHPCSELCHPSLRRWFYSKRCGEGGVTIRFL